ncbi:MULTISPECIES: hypothetical protein [Corallococcus]|uniref:hypothetical protein n=1 Tax=Corallococcus TaxID=83461 RepID=UPI00149494DC|nr:MULTISPECIES: hypothetical protein [Corallococcus]NPC72404.1 hypothetical protein [Corallococcus exiguus]NPD22075.1 hypothetical protein [Corallococcus exiguus]
MAKRSEFISCVRDSRGNGSSEGTAFASQENFAGAGRTESDVAGGGGLSPPV